MQVVLSQCTQCIYNPLIQRLITREFKRIADAISILNHRGFAITTNPLFTVLVPAPAVVYLSQNFVNRSRESLGRKLSDGDVEDEMEEGFEVILKVLQLIGVLEEVARHKTPGSLM